MWGKGVCREYSQCLFITRWRKGDILNESLTRYFASNVPQAKKILNHSTLKIKSKNCIENRGSESFFEKLLFSQDIFFSKLNNDLSFYLFLIIVFPLLQNQE